MNDTITLHPFAEAGLGISPFKCVSVHDMGLGNGTSCDYCSTRIRFVCTIRSADRRDFKVGTDCVNKCNRDDNVMLNTVEREIARINSENKRKEQAARWAEREAARVAALDTERAANGGMTNEEVRAASEAAAKREAIAKYTVENQWLLSRLTRDGGDFISSMVLRLQTGPVSALSPRMLDILRDIYAKSAGRRGSKKYAEAAAEFDAKTISE